VTSVNSSCIIFTFPYLPFFFLTWLEVTYALSAIKNHLLLLEIENSICLAKILQLLGTSMRSTIEFNVITDLYYDPFLIVIANEVAYV